MGTSLSTSPRNKTWDNIRINLYTRLHSSRMRTARLLPVSRSMHCAGGGACLWSGGGGACLWSRGVACLWSRGGLLLGGCLPLVPGGIPACNGSDPPPPVNRILDTRFWKCCHAPTSLRAVNIIKQPWNSTVKIIKRTNNCSFLCRIYVCQNVWFNDNKNVDGIASLFANTSALNLLPIPHYFWKTNGDASQNKGKLP